MPACILEYAKTAAEKVKPGLMWWIVLTVVSAAVGLPAFPEAVAGSPHPLPISAQRDRFFIDNVSPEGDTAISDRKTRDEGISILSGNRLRLGGYTQFGIHMYQPGAGKNSGADLRRIRIKLSGKSADVWQYMFQADFASSPKALDAYVRFSPSTFLNVTAGQFKIPFSRDNLNSSSKLDFIDRAQVVEALSARSTDVIGNQNGRDIGVQLSGRLMRRAGGALVEYAVGVFNGSGINTSDNNNAKDVCGRVVVHPFAGMEVGGSYYDGFDRWGTPAANHNRTRAGLELGLVCRSLSVAGEYIAGGDGATKRNGWYVQGAYFLIEKVLQVAVRYDAFDSDTSVDRMTDVNYVIGANYFFTPAVKLQANYLFRREGTTQIDNDVVEMQLQFTI